MKRIAALVATLVFGCAASALAQSSYPGAPGSSSASLLKVNATKPFPVGLPPNYFGHKPAGRLRLIFRVTTNNGAEMPVVAMGYGGLRNDYVLGWEAVSSSGARCTAETTDTKGVKVFSGRSVGAEWSIRQLQEEETTSSSIAAPVRPTIIVADFNCDAEVVAGDTLSAQLKLFVRVGSRWTPVDYTFENLTVETR